MKTMTTRLGTTESVETQLQTLAAMTVSFAFNGIGLIYKVFL